MQKKRTLYLICAFLVVEAIAFLFLPSRMPWPARALTASINIVAAVVLCFLANQRPKKP